jgi:hypothetical protein
MKYQFYFFSCFSALEADVLAESGLSKGGGDGK